MKYVITQDNANVIPFTEFIAEEKAEEKKTAAEIEKERRDAIAAKLANLTPEEIKARDEKIKTAQKEKLAEITPEAEQARAKHIESAARQEIEGGSKGQRISGAQVSKHAEITPKEKKSSSLDTSSVESMLRSGYGRDAEISNEIRKKAEQKHPDKKAKYGTVYPCYSMNPKSDESFIFYDADKERVFEVFRDSDHRYWRVRIGQKNVTNAPGEEDDRMAEELKENYNRLFVEWEKRAIEDIIDGKYRITGMFRDDSRKVIRDMLLNTLSEVRRLDVKKMQHTVFKMVDKSGDRREKAEGYSAVKQDPLTTTEFNKSLSIGAKADLHRKRIGTLFTGPSDDKTSKKSYTEGREKIADIIESMGLNSEEYTSQYTNTELLQIFNDIIQENPYASAKTKVKWGEILRDLYLEFYNLDTEGVEGVKRDFYGPELYDKKVQNRYNSPEIRKELRIKLWKMLNYFVVASTDVEKYGEIKAPVNKGRVESYERKKDDPLRIRESFYIPSFYEFITEKDEPSSAEIYRRTHAEKSRERAKGKFIGKGTRDVKATMQKQEDELKKLKQGVYVKSGEDQFSQVIFNAIERLNGYIVVKYMPNTHKYRARLVPNPEFIDLFMPDEYGDTFVLNVPGGYLAYGLKDKESSKQEYFASEWLQNKYVLTFDDKDAAHDAADKAKEETGMGATVETYRDAYESYLKKEYAAVDMVYNKHINNTFYSDPAAGDKAREKEPLARSVNQMQGDQAAYRSFLGAVSEVYNHWSGHVAAVKEINKEKEKKVKSDISGGKYDAIAKTMSSEVAEDVKSYGRSPKVAAEKNLYDYLDKSAEIINGMRENKVDGKTVDAFVRDWVEMASMTMEFAGDKFDVGMSDGHEISGEELKAVMLALSNDKELFENNKVKYTVTKSYLQMFMRKIGDALIERASTKVKPEAPASGTFQDAAEKYIKQSYVESKTLPELWKEYMKLVDAAGIEYDLPKDKMTGIRQRLIKVAAHAIDLADENPDFLDTIDAEYPILEEDYADVTGLLEKLKPKAAYNVKNMLVRVLRLVYDELVSKKAQ